ncbi:2-oxoadipate dioxygenase/decarboxylase HglS [Methylocystis heyeri]|uniref:2-oxoadipate dioxygenase/decarboxylase n=1 Tax=Methylocystis heyeri TaxID=391905 RepID=A0A6B8KMR3_9HYPH|nr:DUF1338 family protein [Methylocystis heyeri]QGM48213.1 DUF1338 family protein [Methylocystis heyeri]
MSEVRNPARINAATPFVSADAVRAMFSRAMSDMYKFEAPQYTALAELVAKVNRDALREAPELEEELREASEIGRLGVERHGAIRVGNAEELSIVRRLFAVMGMVPVGYYDLSVAGIPVHSTAFRPIDDAALRRNSFRVFTSLLRLDLIDDIELRREAAAILARREIVTPRARKLLDYFEKDGGFDEGAAREFVTEAVETFRWRSQATVSAELYRKFFAAHPLIADVACFNGPHINHLTLRALDIDAAQCAMAARNMNPKAIVEGPPRRRRPILLRQTSFRALPEPISFTEADGSRAEGVHAARFGEIEQRGAALTAKGRSLYDRLLADAHAAAPLAADGSNAAAFVEELGRRFAAFPDDDATLRAERLAFFRYSPTAEGVSHEGAAPPASIEELLRAGLLRIQPIIYEDFLPVSAAGIFRSNLKEERRESYVERASRKAFEEAMGTEILDELTLYQEAERSSLAAGLEVLGLDPAGAFTQGSKSFGADIGVPANSHN